MVGRVCTGNVGAVEDLSTYRNEEEEEEKKERILAAEKLIRLVWAKLQKKNLGLQQAGAVIGWLSAAVM